MAVPHPRMPYRRLGATGLKVSALSFGSWVTFDTQMDLDPVLGCMQAAHDAGCNLFDNAEAYAGGRSETLMGQALTELQWPRWSYVVTTKLFWGIHGDDPNMRNTLNRKYLTQAIDGSLERLGLEFVDIVYCHRSDPHTPMLETVWAMSDMVSSGKALYWGTSEWTGAQLDEVNALARQKGYDAPIVEQPQYSLLKRTPYESTILPAAKQSGMGLVVWSPLASGLLSGKYNQGIPSNSRLEQMDWLRQSLYTDDNLSKVRTMESLAKDAGCSQAQLALAWALQGEGVSSVITGATSLAQLEENLGALSVELTGELKLSLDTLFEQGA